MKSKVLSLILALTVLCSILSVSTVSYAAVDKGDEIAPATLKATLNYGGTNSSNVAGAVRTTFADRGEVACLISTNSLKPGGNATNHAGFKVAPSGLDLTEPFTFEFEYNANSGVWCAFTFGGYFAFVSDANGKAYLNTRTAYNTTDSQAATALVETWHKVLLNYDGANYRVYLNGVLLKNPSGESAFTPQADNSYLGIGFYPENTLPSTGSVLDRLYVDNVYAYAGAYDPDGNSLIEEVEEDVITIAASSAAKSVTASVTLSDTYATGEYRFYLATYDAQDRELIGITSVDITEAGYHELKVTFETANAFSNVDYAKAFVWNKTNLKPTGVKALLGNEPQ